MEDYTRGVLDVWGRGRRDIYLPPPLLRHGATWDTMCILVYLSIYIPLTFDPFFRGRG